MATALDPNKAKTARRLIEVLEFFDENNTRATVMDIVRRYNRPQSSTSELLAILVDLGLLYRDASSKFYTLTPRAAILGSLSQPRMVRDGRLVTLVDQLAAQTGLGVALIGMVGLNAQVFLWKSGDKSLKKAPEAVLTSGLQERLCDTAAGWLLLSTAPHQRGEGVIRRLNAEAPSERKFSHPEMSAHVQDCRRQGYAIGPAGFGAAAEMCVMLLPSDADEHPMALGLVYNPSEQKSADLVAILEQALRGCTRETDANAPRPHRAPAAA